MDEKITIDQFKQVDMRVGEILSAERVPETDKLLKLSVDLGLKSSAQADDSSDQLKTGLGEERDVRQIISGIAEYFPDTETLVGKRCVFAANLAPREIRGLESNGMILAAHDKQGTFALMVPEGDVVPGTRIG